MPIKQFANMINECNMGTALVQKKDVDNVEISSVFFYSMAVAIIVYLLLFFASPAIAAFYQIEELKIVLRVMALSLFPNALNCVQNAIASKRMEFKKQFTSGLCAAMISGIFGVICASLGFGVWALVVQQLSCQIIVATVMWFLVKWRPELIFSFKKTKKLLKYGVNILGASLIRTHFLRW